MLCSSDLVRFESNRCERSSHRIRRFLYFKIEYIFFSHKTDESKFLFGNGYNNDMLILYSNRRIKSSYSQVALPNGFCSRLNIAELRPVVRGVSPRADKNVFNSSFENAGMLGGKSPVGAS